MEPDLLNSELDLLEGVVLHGIRDKFGGHLDVFVGSCSSGDLIEELAEINTDWKINENTLV